VITLVQRVRRAAVLVGDETVGAIGNGLLLFVGVEHGDADADADATARKVGALRVFPGRTPTDLDVTAAGGACLVVSQFTLAAELRHGNRPDFTAAAPPPLAEALYQRVAAELGRLGVRVATGRFGAAMVVAADNDGPFSLVLRVRGGRVLARGEP
jgi:D-tyrosyl-tRNA(Tyr) deacylase